MTARIIMDNAGETVATVSSAAELQAFLAGIGVVAAVGEDWPFLSMADLGADGFVFGGAE